MAGGMCVGGGACVAHDTGGHAWQGVCMAGGMHGRGVCMARGASMVGGMHGGGMHDRGRGCVWQGGYAWQDRRPQQRTVCNLLECILVNIAVKLL